MKVTRSGAIFSGGRAWLGLWLAGLALAGRAEVTANIAMADGALSSMRLTALPNQLYPGGFLPVRVRIENRAAEARTWRVEFTHGVSMPNRSSLRSAFVFTAPPTTTTETAVFVPAAIFSGGATTGQMRGTIAGPDVANDSFTIPLGNSSRGPGGRIAATAELEATVRKLAVADREEQTRQAAARLAARGRPVSRVVVTSLLDNVVLVDPAQWPADWRTWSQFNGLVMSADRWEALDPARRRALQEWIMLGGRLLLFPNQEGERREEAHGLGSIVTAARPIGSTESAQLRQFVGAAGSVAGHSWPAPELVAKTDALLDLKLGGRWLVGFLIGFAVLIGPVNLFYFAPVGRRHRLFFTVPLISLIGSVLLAVVVVASDGWGGRGYRQALVMLLPAENEAVIVQRQVARTGMIFRRSFALPSDTDLSHRLEGGAGTQNIDLERNGGAAGGDWFVSRSVQYHDLRRVTPTRARVELVDGGRDGRAPVLQSSVGANLRSVLYRDDAGQLWKTADLPSGRRVTLERAADRRDADRLAAFPVAGWFRAEGDASDLAPLPTLDSVRWTDKFIHYTGRVEAASR